MTNDAGKSEYTRGSHDRSLAVMNRSRSTSTGKLIHLVPDLDVQQHIIRPEVPPREHAAWDGSRTWTTYAVLCNQSAQNPILTPLADAPDGVKWCPICVGRYLQRAGKLGAAMKRVTA